MARSEQYYIDLCKKQIEQMFAFGNGQGYTQRDLEVLAKHIENTTGVIISLSTLKRFWKNNYKQSPQLATLNALAQVLDYSDWQSFKQAHQAENQSKLSVLKWLLPLTTIVVVLVWIVGFSSQPEEENQTMDFDQPIEINGPIHFEASKTVTSGIPNTVIFKYDVSNITADTFFIQQSWNNSHRFGIKQTRNAFSTIYYESGYHRAKLIANDSILLERHLHILSDGWEPHVYNSSADERPIDFKNEPFITNGQLHLTKEMLESRNVDFSKRFYSRISNSQIFDVHTDNFNLFTRIKVDSVHNDLCPWMSVLLITEVHIFRVGLNDKGCEKYNSYKLGEISRNGEHNDLSKLGCNVRDWQDLEIRVKDKHAAIYLNGELTYDETFQKDLGHIVGLVFIFDGTGSIDYVRLEDEQGKIAFEDDFELPA